MSQGSSELQQAVSLPEPEVRSGGETQGGAQQQTTASEADAGQMSAPTAAQSSTEQSKDSTASTQQQQRPAAQDQSAATANSSAASASSADPSSSGSNPQGLPGGQKRLHVSNLPFRFRDADLTRLFEVLICSVMERQSRDLDRHFYVVSAAR